MRGFGPGWSAFVAAMLPSVYIGVFRETNAMVSLRMVPYPEPDHTADRRQSLMLKG